MRKSPSVLINVQRGFSYDEVDLCHVFNVADMGAKILLSRMLNRPSLSFVKGET